MPMTKKEKAAFEAMRVQAALRWTAPVKPDVSPHTQKHDQHVTGFLHNSHSIRVEEAWSTTVSHGRGERGSRLSGSQGPRWLYSTRLLALRAMRFEMEQRFAEKLAEVDRAIEAEIAGGGDVE